VSFYILTYEERNYYQCYIDGVLFYVAIQTSVLLIPQTLFKNILIVNINKNKEHIYYNKKTNKKTSSMYLKFIKVMKFFLSPFVSLITLLIYLCTNIIIVLLTIFLKAGNIKILKKGSFNANKKTNILVCSPDSLDAYTIYFHVGNLLMIFITGILIFVDVVSNLKKNLFHKKFYLYFYNFFFFHDAYFVRIEYITGTVLSLFYFIFPFLYMMITYYTFSPIFTTLNLAIIEISLFLLLIQQVFFYLK
jgi:hypothetical protein